MARKGDIDSKSVASRVPMEVYLRLQATASKNKMTLSAYVNELLSKPHYDNGGQLKNVVSAESYSSLKKDHIELLDRLTKQEKMYQSLWRDYQKMEEQLKKETETKEVYHGAFSETLADLNELKDRFNLRTQITPPTPPKPEK